MDSPTFVPPSSAYRHVYRVEAADIDAFGHANNVVWVRWVNDAASAHSCHVGLAPDALSALDAVWLVRRHTIDYLLPAFEGQEIECFTWPESVRGATSLRRNVFQCDGRVLVRAETIWAFLQRSTGRPRRVPRQIMAAYGFVQE
jgi:acyl-CoA thioester hydrolase